MRALPVLLLLLVPLLAVADVNTSEIAGAAVSRFAALLPQGAVARIDSLGAGETAADFAWLLGEAFTQRGVALSDPVQLGRSHVELVRLQDDPVFEGQARPGRFTPPTHRVWGWVTQHEWRRLGKRYLSLEVKLGLEELATGVSLSRFDMEQTARCNPPVWTLLALLGVSLLAVVTVNVATKGHGGPAALVIALVVDLAYLAWYVFA